MQRAVLSPDRVGCNGGDGAGDKAQAQQLRLRRRPPRARPRRILRNRHRRLAPIRADTAQRCRRRCPPNTVRSPANKAPTEPVKKVDLNNASLAELKTLPTVGDAEAKKIIAHRPYKSKGELVTKAGLPEGVYHAVKHKVELQAPRQAAPKK